VPSAACCPRSSGAPPEIWEAARFDVDSAGGDGVGVLVVSDIVRVAGLESRSSLYSVPEVVVSDLCSLFDVVGNNKTTEPRDHQWSRNRISIENSRVLTRKYNPYKH
jgi:hypothetical protein